MSRLILAGLLFGLLSAQVRSHEGFVLRAGEGESMLNGIVMKVSPDNAPTRAILAEQTFQRGGRTGLHVHDQGDELFYVVSGRGTVTLEEETEVVEKGDVIFVPGGPLMA